MATTEATKRSARMPEVISERLEEVRRRESSLRLRTGLVDALALFLVAMLAALLIDWAFTLFSTTVREILTFTALGIGVVGLLTFALLPLLKRKTLSDLAAEVDSSVVGLEERWQTVTEITTSKSREFAGSPVMFDQVVREAIAREPVVDAAEVVTSETFTKHCWIFAGVVAAVLLLFLIDAPRALVLTKRFFAPTSPISLTQISAVEGDAAVPRGEPLRLHADISRRMPETATLFVRAADGSVTDVTLSIPNKEGTGFEYAIATVDQPFSYRFRAGDGETDWHDVSVYDRPRLTGVQFRIASPEYTGLPAVEKAELPAKVRAVEGSTLEIGFTVDQPLEKFLIEFGKDEQVTVSPDKADPLHYVFRQTLDKTIRFSPVFKSQHGLENLRIPSCQVVVYADRAPQVTIVSPEKEISVRPDDTVDITINARDDFGVARAELIAYVGEVPDMENAVVIPFEPVVELGTAATEQSGAGPSELTDSQTATVNEGEATTAERNSNEAASNSDSQNKNPTDSAKIDEAAKSESDSADPSNKDDAERSTTNSDKSTASEAQKLTGDNARSNNSQQNDKTNSTSNSEPSSTESTNQDSSNNNTEKSGQPPSSKDSAPNMRNAAQPSSSNPSASRNNSSAGTNRNPKPVSAGAPPRTVVMPIPLNEKAGGKNIREKLKLDVSQFQLKQGEQLQYMVRVYDTRDTSSEGQSYAGASQSPKPEDMLAKTNPTMSPDLGNSGPNRAENGAEQGQGQPSNGQQSSEQQPSAGNATMADSQSATGNAANIDNQTGEDARNSQGNASSSTDPSRNSATNGSSNNSTDPAANASRSASSSDAVARVASENAAPNAGDAQSGNSSGQNNPQNDPNGQGSSGEGSSDQNQQNNTGQSSSSGSQSDSGSQQSPPSEPSQGQVTGAPQPENPMARRRLDVESQSSASSTMRIHIDRWAGSFESQQREKLEIQIDPVLKELDAVLARALEFLKPPLQAAGEGKPLNDEQLVAVRGVETQIERGESLVGDLVKKTDGTPYAFIGLQLIDITGLHISPAHVEVNAVTTDSPEKQAEHLKQVEFHITRAREMLVDLTKSYEDVKQNARLVEEFQRIKNMYQIFVEDSLAMLGSSKPELNSRDRKMVDLELDKEFLDKYTELQKRWQEILAELAKVLAKDPRLLERYMNMSRQSADTLRDQLTILHRRQKDLLVPTEQLANPPKDIANAKPQLDPKSETKADPKKDGQPAQVKRPTAAEIVRSTLVRDMGEIAEAATAAQENLTTWLPRNIDVNDERIAPLREQSVKVAGLAGRTAAAVAKGEKAEATKLSESLAIELKVFEDGLAALADADDPQLVTHVNRRLARVRNMQQKLIAWTEKQGHINDAQLNRALEVDQHQLAEETLSFVDKLGNLEAQLGGLPEDVLILGDELRDIIRYDVLVDQMSSELRLRDADLPESRDHQQHAIEGFARAEAQFDKLIDRIIEEQDKQPPQVPDLDNMQLPTLEELLARLEAEQDLAELLGIPGRPTNLQQLQDWLMRSSGGGGMGSGVAAAGGLRAMMMERARQDALRSIRRAGEVGNNQSNTTPARRWNKLASQLDDVLRQGRGNTPPKQYRQAIERYFELISGAGVGTELGKATKESTSPASKPANTDTPKND